MNGLKNDLRYALRLFVKAPGFVTIAVLVLGVGIGANTAMFSFANELLVRPLWGGDRELVGVYSRDRTVPDSYQLISYPAYQDIKASGVFEATLAQTYTLTTTPAADGTRRLLAAVVSSDYFDTLGVTLAAGRPFTADEERPGARVPAAIAPYASWKKAGFDPAFIGQTVRINTDDYTIVGVAPDGFTGTLTMLSPEIYLPLGVFESVVDDRIKNSGRGLGDRSNFGLSVAGRLPPGLTTDGATARLDALSRSLEAAYPSDHKNLSLSAASLSRLSLSAAPSENTALTTFASFLLALSSLVLVVACLNIANMLLARGAARRKEIAVRLALGAKRFRVVRQLLTESLVLASAGAAVGLALSYWAMQAFVNALDASLPFRLSLNPVPNLAVLAATVGFTALGALAFGLGPALGLSRRDLVSDLKDRSQEAGGRRRFHAKNVMVVAQVALSLALLTAGGVFTRTTTLAAAGRPGYNYDGLIVARIDPKLAGLAPAEGSRLYADVLDRLRAETGVSAATLTSSLPFGESVDSRLVERVGGGNSQPSRARSFRIVGAGYFSTLGLKPIRGREFLPSEESASGGARVAIVDQVLARSLFGEVDPIGQVIRVAAGTGSSVTSPGEPMAIVGIAPPMRQELLDKAPVAHLYVPFGQHYRSDMFVQVRFAAGADVLGGLNALRSTVGDLNPRVPVLMSSTLQAFHDGSPELLALTTTSAVFTALGAVAMIIACIGVYGLRAYMVARRTREIGIRMALGATSREVVGLILKDGAYLTLGGLAAGIPLALLASLAVRSVFVDVGGIDVVVLLTASVALTLAVTIAGAVPARRASKVEPLTALRTE